MKKKYILIFNKISGAYAGRFDYDKKVEDKLDKNLVSHKIVEMTDNEIWQGDYESGAVTVPDPDRVVVDEEEMNILAGKKVESKYPLHKQLNVLSDMMELLSESVDKEDPRYEAFETMRGFIYRTRANNQRYIESAKIAEDRKFISIEEKREEESKILEGPFRSIVGRT